MKIFLNNSDVVLEDKEYYIVENEQNEAHWIFRKISDVYISESEVHLDEIWAHVSEALYAWVSTNGRVYTEGRKSINNHVIPGKLRKLCNDEGYYRVPLKCADGKFKDFAVHRLVGSAFIDGASSNLTINHKDGVKSNNFVGNLEWCTAQENIKHFWNADVFETKRDEFGKHSSNSNKQNWAEPGFRKNITDKAKKRYSDPKRRQELVDNNTKRWSDEDEHQKLTELNKQRWSDPEYKQKMAEKQKQRWADPEYRKKMSEKAKQRYQDPERRAQLAANNDKRWAEYRKQKMLKNEHVSSI